jgi:formylglycine-generating enzyme required for sulfatase activity/predicted  nucleic acid-binding Zn-ribbon protein
MQFIFLFLPIFLYGDIGTLISKTVSDIGAKTIDETSLEYSEAKKIFDETNLKLEEQKSRFKSQTLKLSIDASYLHRTLSEKERDIESLSSTLNRKRAKLEQIEADIRAEKSYVKELQKLLNRKLSFNSNISTQGYLFAFVEDKRSVSRDIFIDRAVQSINREAIEQLNGIFIESISKFNKTLSQRVRETSSGTAISDSSETTIKLFFSNSRSNSVMIYGTTVDVYPFEKGEVISRHKRKNFKESFVTLVRDGRDIPRILKEISKKYPKLEIPTDLESKLKSALDSISKHNSKSEDAIRNISSSQDEFQKKIQNRISSRKDVLIVLESHQKLAKSEVEDLEIDLKILHSERENLENEFISLQRKLVKLKRSITFQRAEMYDRKHSNAVEETKSIAKELLLDIDKSLLKTSKSMETVFNGSEILKDVVNEVEYEKIYVGATVTPYFVSGTDRTGALVSLEIEFRDKRLPEISELEEERFVKIPKGKFRFGSNSGESDEKPEIEIEISKEFYIGKYEVTRKEYMEFANAVNGHYPKKYRDGCIEDTCPIVGISWIDAVAYTEWLSKKSGEKYRLPTEIEWEYVAKGDLNLDFGFLYGKLSDHAWYFENSIDEVHAVGLKKPNLFGAYDMNGNIWELCGDSYNYNFRTKRYSTYKVMRGGDFKSRKFYVRSSNRAKFRQDRKSPSVGFRLVKE